jgi:hypothetical protein
MGLMKYILCTVIFFALNTFSFGAYTFNGTNAYVETNETAGLYLPDGDWTIAVKVQVPNNAGTNNKFIYNTLAGDFPASGNIDQYIVQDSHPTTDSRGDLWTDVSDDGGDASGDFGTGGTPPFTGNTAWTHVILQRSGNTLTQYAGSTTGNGSFTNAGFDGVTPTGMHIGARYDLESTRFFSGNIAELAIWNRALNTAEIDGIIDGMLPTCYIRGLQFYMPMIREYVEYQSRATVTNHGSAVGSHPRVFYPN